MTLQTGPFVAGPFISGPFVAGPFGNRYGGPALDLNFIVMAMNQVLDPRITFTRAGNATQFDSAGRLVWALANMCPRSESFGSAEWALVAGGVTKTLGVSDPNGGTAAVTLTSLGANGGMQIGPVVAVVGQSYTVSAWIRRRTGTGQIQLRAVENANTNITVTSSWQRFSAAATATGTVLRIGVTIVTTGDEIDFAFPQAEPTGIDSPKAYNSTGSSASSFHGPRLDYNPATLAARGLLVEEARTNLAPVSEDLTDAVIVKAGCTISGSIASPAVRLANRVQENSSLSEHYVGRDSMTTTAATAYTGSAFIKANQRTRAVVNFRCSTGSDTAQATFDLSNGTIALAAAVGGAVTNASATIQSVGGGWYRCTLTATTDAGVVTSLRIKLDDGSTTSYTGDGASGLYVWGLQLELGAFATSYIPTFGSTATRAAEGPVNMATGGWFNSAAGTWGVDYIAGPVDGVNTRVMLSAHDGTDSNRVIVLRTTIGRVQTIHTLAGVSTFSPTGTVSILQGAAGKAAATYSASGKRLSADGLAIVSDSTSAAMPTLTTLTMGGNRAATAGAYHGGWISRIRYWPRADFTDAQLQALST